MVNATAEPVEAVDEALNIASELPWPTERGPFYVSATWMRINGRSRMTGITVRTVPDGTSHLSEFVPLTAQTFRRVRIGDIVDQLVAERRSLHEGVLDGPRTSPNDETRRMLEDDRPAWDERHVDPRPRNSPDDDLLEQVGRLFDSAHADGLRSPASFVLDQLGELRPDFAVPSPAVRSAYMNRVGRLIRRARDAGYLQTPPLTKGRQRKDGER